MTVRAKFYVSKIDRPEGATASTVYLGAVCRGIENAMWSQFTPAGSIQMSIKNDLATDQFEYGAEYEVTFTKVAKPQPNDGHEIKPAVDKNGVEICEFCGMTLGHTDEAVAKESWKAPYNTPEKRAEYRALHKQAFGAKDA